MKHHKNKKNLLEKIKESPINYFSDAFIIAMVVLWIFDNIYEALIASAVTVSSIIISFQTGSNSFETSMWSSIGTNVAIPLASGGAIWMIKNSVQHAIMNKMGKKVSQDFPSVNADGEDDGIEHIMEPNENIEPISDEEEVEEP